MRNKIARLFISCLVVVSALATIAYRMYIYVDVSAKPPLLGEYKARKLDVNGLERSYSLYVPKNLRQTPGLVMVLHGSRGNGDVMRRLTAYQFEHWAEKQGFIVVYPDGFENHWNDCRASAGYAANVENIDDVGFLLAIQQDLAREFNVSARKRFVVGYSNGGHMAYRLALSRPTMFGAYAAVMASLPVDSNNNCEQSGQAVSVSIFNGTEDPVNPYNGGEVVLFGNNSRGSVLSSAATAEYFVALAKENANLDYAHHERADDDGNEETSVIVEAWQSDSVSVFLYTIQGGGHIIPSPFASFGRLYGGNAADIDLAEELVDIWALGDYD